MEIKFRIWNEEVKEMIESKDIRCIDFNSNYFSTIMFDDFYGYETEYKLMQYTGMKDCNGKEIYEGDIVKVKERMAGEDLIGKVIYDETEGCYWIMQGEENNCFKTIFDLDYEHYVIGNIYENKEMLER